MKLLLVRDQQFKIYVPIGTSEVPQQKRKLTSIGAGFRLSGANSILASKTRVLWRRHQRERA